MRRLLRANVHCAYITPLLVLVGYLYLHRKETVGDLLRGNWFLALLVALSLLFWLSRTTFLDSINRSFAGEEHDLQTPPGTHLRSFASAVFSKRSFQLVIEPTLRDLLDEYCEALSEGHPRKARWACLRGYFSFWSAVLAQIPVSLTKLIFTVWKGIQ